MPFEAMGLEAVLENITGFLADASKFNAAISGMVESAKGAEDATKPTDTWIDRLGESIDWMARIAGGVLIRDSLRWLIDNLKEVGSEAFTAAGEFQALQIRFQGLIARELSAASGIEVLRVTGEKLVGLTEKEQKELDGLNDKLRESQFNRDSLSEKIRIAQMELTNLTSAEDRNEVSIANKQLQLRELQHDYATSTSTIQEYSARVDELSQKSSTYEQITEKVRVGQLGVNEELEEGGKRAKELLDWIKNLAVTTPFTVEGLSNTLAFAQAFGFTTTEAKRLTVAIGNFTAGMGLGNTELQRIILNFGQLRAQGFINQRELNDLARGSLVPVNALMGELAKKYNTTTTEVKALSKEGKISVDEFFDEFIKMAERDFPNAMERFGNTWKFAISNVHDFIQSIVGAELLGPFVEKLATRVNVGLKAMLTPEIREQVREWGKAIGDAVEFILAKGEIFFGQLNELATAVLDAFGVDLSSVNFVEIFRNVVNWIGQLILKGASLVAWLRNTLPGAIRSAQTTLSPFIDTFKRIWSVLWDPTASPEEKVKQLFALILHALDEFVVSATRSLYFWSVIFVSWIDRSLPDVVQALLRLVDGILNFIGENSGTITNRLSLWAQAFVGWLTPAAQVLWTTLQEDILPVLDQWITDTGAWLMEKILFVWVPAFVIWLNQVGPQLIYKLGYFLGQLGTWVIVEGARLIKSMFETIGALILAALGVYISKPTGIWLINNFLGGLWDGFMDSSIMSDIKKAFRPWWLAILTLSREVWAQIVNAWNEFWWTMYVAAVEVLLWISTTWQNTWAKIWYVAVDIWNKINDAIWGTAEDIVLDLIVLFSGLDEDLMMAWINVKNGAISMWNQIYDAIVRPATDLYYKVKEKFDLVWGIITDPRKRQEAINAGRQWIQGIIDGLWGMAGQLYTTVTQIMQAALARMRWALGFGSPSKYGIAYGYGLGTSMAMGLEQARGAIEKAAAQMVLSLPAPAQPAYAQNISSSTAYNLTLQGGAIPPSAIQDFNLMKAMWG